jgi:hypothetical protein
VVHQQRCHQRGPTPWIDRANYTAVEVIPIGEEELTSMFFLHNHPIIILFDSGASHDFMSSVCAKKAKLSLVATEAPYVISTPRGRVDVDRIVQKVSLEMVGWIFHTNLIILSGQGIDVILGMSLMKLHKVMLDIVAHLVHLNSPVYVKVTLHLSTISHIKGSMDHVVEKRLKEIHVVWEFPNVFLDDLLGMPPKRAI